MRRARTLSKLSADLIDYLVERKKLTQSDVAAMLRVDKSFISRVRAGERELSPTQMDEIASRLGVPLGVMLIDITSAEGKVSESRRKLLDLCDDLMRQADSAISELKAEASRPR